MTNAAGKYLNAGQGEVGRVADLSNPSDKTGGAGESPGGFEGVRVAIVHDWLAEVGGAEKVLGEVLKVFPNAALFSLLDTIPQPERGFLLEKPVHTTFLQKIPGIKKLYRALLPLMPLAVEHLDVSSYELIISSSHAVAKGVITGPDQLHLCYCHSPVRYAWDMQELYLGQTGCSTGVAGFLARALLHYIRIWDSRTPNGVDAFAANSSFVARRIWKVYRRKCRVIYPPVDRITVPGSNQKREHYVSLGRLVPYKRVDLLVETFREMPDRKLHVIGDGPERRQLEKNSPPNVRFFGRLSKDRVIEELSGARALIFPGEEDFGIVPVEAQSAGVPVVAYSKGGASETVLHGKTGVLFENQSVDSLKEAILALEKLSFDSALLRGNANRFAPEVFQKGLHSWAEAEWRRFKARTASPA